MRIRRLAPLALGLLLLAPSASRAAHQDSPPLRPFHPALGVGQENFFVSDGIRYFVWENDDRPLQIYDTVAHTQRDLRPALTNCTFQDSIPNALLLYCGGERRGPRILRLKDGALTEVRGAGVQAEAGYLEMGRHWLGGSYHEGGGLRAAYLNWRTGESRTFPYGARRDLDDPALAPVPGGPDAVFQREGDRVLTGAGPYEPGPLVLRGPKRRRIVLSDCRNPCGAVRMSAGLVTWSEHFGQVRAYDARTGRLFRWEFLDWPSSVGVWHTRKHVLSFDPGEPRCMCARGLAPAWARVRK